MGTHKAMDHPDVHTLALMAESAGLDFRVLVLQRNAAEILKSVAKREFGGPLGAAGEPKILIENAAALYTQLALIDSSFYRCIQYNRLGNLTAEERNGLATFLHPANTGTELDVMLREVKYSSGVKSEENRTASRSLDTVNSLPPQVQQVKRPPLTTERMVATQEYYTLLLQSGLSLIDNLCTANSL